MDADRIALAAKINHLLSDHLTPAELALFAELTSDADTAGYHTDGYLGVTFVLTDGSWSNAPIVDTPVNLGLVPPPPYRELTHEERGLCCDSDAHPPSAGPVPYADVFRTDTREYRCIDCARHGR